MYRRTIALLLGLAFPSAARAQGVDAFTRDFLAADSEAREVLKYFECFVKQSGYAGQVGTNGTVVCVQSGGRMMAVVVVGGGAFRSEIFSAVDVNTDIRIAAPDTAEVLTMLRVQTSARSRAVIDSRPDTGEFLPPVVYRADTVIHAWVVPLSVAPKPLGATQAGGEHHYVFNRDGTRELSTAPVPPRVSIKGLVDGTWTIESRDSIPSFSELLMAHLLRKDHRPVTIVTPTRIARLAARDSTGAWTFEPRKP